MTTENNNPPTETPEQQADREFVELTPEQQQAVQAIAGTDRAARTRTVAALRPTWGPNHAEAHAELEKENPIAAARYYLLNRKAIEAQRKRGAA